METCSPDQIIDDLNLRAPVVLTFMAALNKHDIDFMSLAPRRLIVQVYVRCQNSDFQLALTEKKGANKLLSAEIQNLGGSESSDFVSSIAWLNFEEVRKVCLDSRKSVRQ